MKPLLSVPPEALQFLRDYDRYLLLGHIEPDADCLGSQIALARGLTRLGKQVELLNPGPFERQEILPLTDSFLTDPAAVDIVGRTAAVLLDCSTPDRIHPFDTVIDGLPILVVDHHRTTDEYGTVHFIDPTIPANTMMVLAILETIADGPTAAEAESLFLGLVTDTGFFRFLEAGQHLAFEAASRLTALGASPRATAELLGGGRSWGSRQLIARMLSRTERLVDGSVLLTHMTAQDEQEFGTRRDSDALYRLLLAVENVRVVAVVKQKKKGCTISFRANDDTDVSIIAAEFGGGGHQKASGAFTDQDLETFLPVLRNRLLSVCNSP